MTTQHTPGPWHAQCLDEEEDVWFVLEPLVVATSNEANARLIATAPALLEAAKAVEWGVGHYNADDSLAYRTCPSCGGPDRPDYIGPDGHFPACQLRAAIAAAEAH